MMKKIAPFLLVILFAVGALVYSAAYVVDETEQVIVTRFGKPIYEPIDTAGLKFKFPWEKANFFEKRLLRWDGKPTEVPTKDKKFIWVDITGRWKIVDPLKFMKTMATENQAQSRLDDVVNGYTRDAITSYDLVEIVRSTDMILMYKPADDEKNEIGFSHVTVGRDKITREILENAKASIADFGIELVDVRIKRLNYISRVRKTVYDRMISERNQASEELRSEGKGESAKILGSMEKRLQEIKSEAYRTSEETKGKADAEAIKIYADAYSKDPEFYQFIKTLELYPKTLNKTSLILSTDIEFLKYLENSHVKQAS